MVVGQEATGFCRSCFSRWRSIRYVEDAEAEAEDEDGAALGEALVAPVTVVALSIVVVGFTVLHGCCIE